MGKIGLRTAQCLQKKIMAFNCLKTFKMKMVDMTTKVFCMLALGISKSESINYIDVSHNQLDNRSVKSIETLMRYINNIHYMNISENSGITDDQKKYLKKLIMNINKGGNKDIRVQ